MTTKIDTEQLALIAGYRVMLDHAMAALLFIENEAENRDQMHNAAVEALNELRVEA